MIIAGTVPQVARRAARWCLAALLSLVAGLAFAQGNSIESVTTVRSGSATQVRIRLKTPPAVAPSAFSIGTPPRVALDLVDTANGAGKSTFEIDDGDVRSVVIVQSGKRARVVMNLKRAAGFTTAVEGSTVVVAIAPVESAAAGSEPAAYTFAKEATGGAHALRDVDFRRGKDGEGRVVVELSDPGVGVDIRQQGQTVVVDFLKTRLPENLRRRLDVTDFGTPVKSVRTFVQGDNTRLVIEPQGQWEHNAYQSDTQFVVEVKPIREDPAKAARAGYRGERLSLNFQNIDVRSLLQVIADFTNLNIVASDTVTGSLTLRLKDVPWDQALDIILQSRGLDMRKNGNVVVVAPREELATKEKLDLETRQQIAEIEPVRTEVFQLNYAKAEDILKLLVNDKNDKQRVLSKQGSANFDARTNKLFVKDTATWIEEVRKLIAQVDIPVRQVLIEARIVEADDRFTRNLGAKLGFNDLRSSVYRSVTVTDPVTGNLTQMNVPVYGAGTSLGGGAFASVSGNLAGVANVSSQNGPGLLAAGTTTAASGGAEASQALYAAGLGQAAGLANSNFVNLPASAISGVSPASMAISLFGSSLTRFVNLELSALEADQRGKVISSPRVLTADKRKASIEQGTQLPFQQATSSGATSITFKDASLKLEVTPHITPDGNVIMTVRVSRDAIGQLTPAGYAIDKRTVETEVLVENGGTVVIGGIYEQVERNTENKVPLLGDLPVVGYAFKSTVRRNDRNELLVFLTPRVVADTATAR